MKEKEAEKEGEEKTDLKYTLMGYFSFLKSYKILIVIILFLVFFHEARHIIECYLFKVLIDN